ncbi:DUF559 domain-containing protein [Kribbella antibiotica]|uniref:DUF559 domain-containing protein n=1 Tax=Kribbella antibiotica TaxID=190195 RepID=A0A4R4YU68_9ACTN|nr:type IV toxin-antitoxin system AbiEi family antitoxin domain-containing protein [Kribbella antibiotica]TDD48908.1 DUF559 domain-containing protein [Kribbella antibiotica]
MPLVADTLASLDGSAAAAQLRLLVPRAALERAVQSGEIERVARGVYALPGLGPERLAALAYDGVVSHLSAAHLWGLPLLDQPDKPHIILPPRRHPRYDRPAVLHWATVTAEERRTRITTPLRTVADCTRILPFGEGLAVADAALRARLVTQFELHQAATNMRGPGRPNALLIAAAATALAESFLESILRGRVLTAGLTGFEPQVEIYDETGFIARVDLGHRPARLAVEAEGREFHSSATALNADCRRYNNLVAAGWRVLRFTYQQIINEPDWVINRIQTALALRTLTPLTTRLPHAA